ncbi:peptidyl-prolyl cis-trans isomerase, cyclophilin-type [Necator americanus]|uniref:Peptidyl-prolyl cis-trans isomerase, cyclophilin-type n=1 Tax=Necator americanus TaxID=51031 RepID=W2SV34_NECAM|nr:peptidyl-prolyl cis-trans isomerase, cyclophilin-type [Necator americanus]ETN73368.1 peptidyl-prolyl cis-trans isomerase, cyclophilin-type [Necator americanus]
MAKYTKVFMDITADAEPIGRLVFESGDFETQNEDRKGGKSTFDNKYFEDENYDILHNKRGILSMDNFGWPDTNSSRFFVTFTNTPWMNNFHVAFGELVDGFDVLDKMESYGIIEEEICLGIMLDKHYHNNEKAQLPLVQYDRHEQNHNKRDLARNS